METHSFLTGLIVLLFSIRRGFAYIPHSQSLNVNNVHPLPWKFSQLSMATADDNADDSCKRVVVIGNGMVGQRFLENMIRYDTQQRFKLTTFCEEPRAAYNRVKLTSYFETMDPSSLSMTGTFDSDGQTAWYKENGVEIFIKDKIVAMDTQSKTVTSQNGQILSYDTAIFATGSVPFVPPIPGRNRKGVFVYRTIEDLNAITKYVQEYKVQSAAIIGGGLLGLEAAKAVADLNVKSYICEHSPILMSRQIDQGGHNALVGKIESMGLNVKCGARTESIVGSDGTMDNDSTAPVAALKFSNEGWEDLPVQMVVISAGIKPRDELARSAGIAVGERGGIIVDDQMRTSAKDVFAIGEVALHKNFIYGLVAPGYTMADICSKVIVNAMKDDQASFTGADLSTKLKLLGCDVASFGVNQPNEKDLDVSALIWNDPIQGVYRKLIFNKDGTKLRGGILVGDASDYSSLHSTMITGSTLKQSPSELLTPMSARRVANTEEAPAADANAQVCSCNSVTAGNIAAAVAELGAQGATLAAIKKCTRAATGCGGCEPQVKSIIAAEVKKMGGKVSNHLCEHFHMSRPELMLKIRLEEDPSLVDSYEKILAKHGHGDGCEVCKPAVASIMASLYNGVILNDGRDALQDTNDRSLANMQRGGTYSVVPRVPGGELSPDQLIALGETAKKFQLYTKITGAQRVDLFGAAKYQLPDIWQDLGKAGFESGHAYGKALRTVKSCVGSTWCRYGVQDSVSFAVRVENRYKGVRSPHKMKGGVSGCIRECAEAQGKDFGLIATENGYNLYVGGNGGANPIHAELLAADIDEDTVIKYLDRYIMYYILTADRLERTAVWQKKLPRGKNGGGPIEHLKEVIIEDSLGICAELERRMDHLVATYHDEWQEVVKDPAKRKTFQQFVNTEQTQSREEMIEFVDIRGQTRPADWPQDGQPQTNWHPPKFDVFARSEKSWIHFGKTQDFAPNVGSPVLYGHSQLAIFNNAKRGEWYCTQNMCPHKQAFVLSQGILGSVEDIPKVACPLHKKNFNLQTGKQIGDGDLEIITFPVKVEGDSVFVQLPSEEEVDAILGTNGLRVLKSDCVNFAEDAIKIPSRKTKQSLTVMKAHEDSVE